MTKLKKFKETAPTWMKLSLIDILEMMDQSKTNKFLPMIVNIVDTSFKNRINSWGKEDLMEFTNRIERTMPHLKGTFNDMEPSLLYGYYNLLDKLPNNELETLLDFIEMYEKHQITGIDVNKLKTINDVEGIVNLINIKNIGKEFEKQTYVDLDTEKWLVIRPLTYESSVKYGSNTKWCTSARSNPYQYFKYTETGVLVYCINKETGYKLALHMWREGNKSYEISFWNSVDDKIDSLSADIDFDVYNLVRKIYTSSETKTNKELGGEYWTKSCGLHLKDEEMESEPPIPYPIDYVIERTVPARIHTIVEPTNEAIDWPADGGG
jgi:hypothetical protein